MPVRQRSERSAANIASVNASYTKSHKSVDSQPFIRIRYLSNIVIVNIAKRSYPAPALDIHKLVNLLLIYYAKNIAPVVSEKRDIEMRLAPYFYNLLIDLECCLNEMSKLHLSSPTEVNKLYKFGQVLQKSHSNKFLPWTVI